MDTLILYALAAIGLLLSLVKDKKKTLTALKKAWKAFEGILPQLLTVVLIIAISLSILDKTFISKLLGTESGLFGIIGAALVGAITLIPGFVAFPLAAALLANGAGVVQVATFVSSLMMVGVITLPMEIKYFGKRIAFTRNLLAFGFSFGAAFFVGWVVSL